VIDKQQGPTRETEEGLRGGTRLPAGEPAAASRGPRFLPLSLDCGSGAVRCSVVQKQKAGDEVEGHHHHTVGVWAKGPCFDMGQSNGADFVILTKQPHVSRAHAAERQRVGSRRYTPLRRRNNECSGTSLAEAAEAVNLDKTGHILAARRLTTCTVVLPSLNRHRDPSPQTQAISVNIETRVISPPVCAPSAALVHNRDKDGGGGRPTSSTERALRAGRVVQPRYCVHTRCHERERERERRRDREDRPHGP